MLSERAQQLIPKARIFTVATIENQYPAEANCFQQGFAPMQSMHYVSAIFQQADDNGKYLSDSDLEKIKKSLPQLTKNVHQAQLIRDKAEEIVEKARKEVLIKFPQITEPGGELYPPMRAEACWRDFWHFLRCISYGIAGKITNFTSEEGLRNMELLYQELKVPLPAMIVGLENLKNYSLTEFSTAEKAEVTVYFDHLIKQMKTFTK